MTVEIYEVRGTFPDMTLAYHTSRTSAERDARNCKGVVKPIPVKLTKKGVVVLANQLWLWRDNGIVNTNENEDTYKPAQDKK